MAEPTDRSTVVVDTGSIMAVVAYRSKLFAPMFDRVGRDNDLVISNFILMQCARQASGSERRRRFAARILLVRSTNQVVCIYNIQIIPLFIE